MYNVIGNVMNNAAPINHCSGSGANGSGLTRDYREDHHMYVLYQDTESRSLRVAKVPPSMTGKQFVNRTPGAIHWSDHTTEEEAQQRKEEEENPPGGVLGKGD